MLGDICTGVAEVLCSSNVWTTREMISGYPLDPWAEARHYDEHTVRIVVPGDVRDVTVREACA